MASRPRPIRTRRAAVQLGAQLAESRERLGFSVDQLAGRASITPGTLRRVENGEPSVGLGEFLTVVRALGRLDAVLAALAPGDDGDA